MLYTVFGFRFNPLQGFISVSTRSPGRRFQYHQSFNPLQGFISVSTFERAASQDAPWTVF